LIDTARRLNVLVISSRCAHAENDPEFQIFPPHCIRGTRGAEIISEGMMPSFHVIENNPAAALPAGILESQQIVIEKQMLDVFTNPHTSEVVEQLGEGASYFVFGVVTEYCVHCAAKGLLARRRTVSIVEDAIETLDASQGQKNLSELQSLGARLISTVEAIAQLEALPARAS
jgi:nicotinamidase/pyrazinamidase